MENNEIKNKEELPLIQNIDNITSNKEYQSLESGVLLY